VVLLRQYGFYGDYGMRSILHRFLLCLFGTVCILLWEVTMLADYKPWEEWYMQAILEVSGQKMPERISATRRAIATRLRDLEHDSDHHAERHEIESALRALSTLEEEVKEWQS
jgi:hypothetical protein